MEIDNWKDQHYDKIIVHLSLLGGAILIVICNTVATFLIKVLCNYNSNLSIL